MELFRLFGSIFVKDEASKTLDSVEKKADGTNNKLQDMGKKAQDVGGKFTDFGKKCSDFGGKLFKFTTLPILGAGTASVKMASDFNENLNKMSEVFKGSANEVEKWSKGSVKNMGMAQSTALDMVSLFGDMSTSMGLNTNESSKMSMNLTQLAADMASFKNISVDRAQTALAGVFTGETESLKGLGVVMTQTNLEQFAMSQGIKKNIKDMSEAEKVQLRYAYVMDKTKNAQGDFARTSGGTANQLRIFKESIKELGASFGQILLPIITPIITKLNSMAQNFANLDEKSKKTIITIGGIVAGIAPVLIVVGKLSTGIGAVIKAFGLVSGAVAKAGGAMALLTNPITIVIAVVAGLIAIFVALYKNNEEFRNNVNVIWGQIKQTISGIIENIKIVISVFVQVATQLWKKYGDDIIKIATTAFNLIANVVKTIMNVIASIIKIVTGIISGDWGKVWSGIKDLFSSVWNGIKSIVSSGINFIKSIITTAWNIIKGVTSSVWNGIKTAITTPINAAKETVRKVVESIKGFFGNIKLPEIKIPKIKMPHFKLKGSFSLAPPSVPKLDVDWFSEGAIFTRPTVFGGIGVGDANNGRGSAMEAVLPISKLSGILADTLKQMGLNKQDENNKNNSPFIINIKEFNNNREQDIKNIAEELRFYIEQQSYAKGGVY